MSFWNSRPTHQSDEQAILLSDNFEGKIQNIKNDDTGRISSTAFNLYKQPFRIINIYESNKPYQRENFFQSLTILLTSKIPLLEETSIW